MNEQKSFLTYFAEMIEQYRAARRQMQTATAETTTDKPSKLPRLVRWLLPNGGTLLIVLLLIATQSLWSAPLRAPSAASTSTISYQGRLADAGGNPLSDNVNMAFRIYDVPNGGTPLWEESWMGGNSVEVNDGLFNVMLGSIDTTLAGAIAGHDELYLGVTVGTDTEMSPRVQLGSVPFAMQAMTVADDSITNDKIAPNAVGSDEIANEAVTLEKMGLAKYGFSTNQSTGASVIRYRSTSLDLDTCSQNTWCCNAEEALCYYPKSSGDSVLEFSLNGAPSIACTLLHSDDDSPGASKGFYYATDGGNSCHMNNQCVRLSKDGVSGNPISLNAGYAWLCGW